MNQPSVLVQKIANLTGCVIGAMTAANQLPEPKKSEVLDKGEEALSILKEYGYALREKEKTSEDLPFGLPTFEVIEIQTGKIILEMNEINKPAKSWHLHFTR